MESNPAFYMLKIDLQHPNFEYYFLDQADRMTEAQKEVLPKELLYKIFRKRYRIETKQAAKLTFFEKLFILVKSLNKRWILIIEDDAGLSIDQYKELPKSKDFEDGTFVLSGTDLVDTYEKINAFNTSSVYNYLMRLKTKRSVPPDEFKQRMKFISKFLNNYEAQRKKIAMDTGISMAEWLTLTYLYDGEIKQCSILYKEKFKYSYNCSSTKIKLSFSTLQGKGYIVKHGSFIDAKFQITAVGRQKINEIMEKYVVNC